MRYYPQRMRRKNQRKSRSSTLSFRQVIEVSFVTVAMLLPNVALAGGLAWPCGACSSYRASALYDQGGYGEYAEYGPWARGRYYTSGCHSARQPVWTESGWLFRLVTVCD